jgi:aspartyl-tRNA synthetase
VLFFDIRDRHGITQVVVHGDALEAKAKRLRPSSSSA